MPAGVLDRPRIDVMFRVSGFFRDAFPAQIDLLDSAIRAVAALDEPDDVNPIAARVRADARALEAQGDCAKGGGDGALVFASLVPNQAPTAPACRH